MENMTDYLEKQLDVVELDRQEILDYHNQQVIQTNDGVECELCGNKGYTRTIDTETRIETVVRCECYTKRKIAKKIKKYNLDLIFNYQNLDNYFPNRDWQNEILEKAKNYAVHFSGSQSFFIGGQVGSGKTHIVNGILKQLVENQDIDFEYINWREDSIKLKDYVFNCPEKYMTILDSYKRTDVLVIDDLFKGNPSEADIKLAFEIINHRYINRKATLITSEKTTVELVKIDEAVGSRIFEMTGSYGINIKKNEKFNARTNTELRKKEN